MLKSDVIFGWDSDLWLWGEIPPDAGEIWSWLTGDKSSSAFAGTVKRKSFLHRSPFAHSGEGWYLQETGMSSTSSQEHLSGWVTAEHRVHGDANYHLPPLTLPTSDFLKSLSGNFVFLSLCVRLRCSASCRFALRVIMLSGIGPSLMENDVGVVGFNSCGCLQRIFHVVSSVCCRAGCWVSVASQGNRTSDMIQENTPSRPKHMFSRSTWTCRSQLNGVTLLGHTR